jgi:ribosomal protein S10|tara:strand:- start:34956 stop:35432 length:477 start_codon:yes stop_codon:yes gene_type:complete
MLFLNIDIKLSSKNQKQLKRFLIILKSFKSKCKLNLKVYLFSNIISKKKKISVLKSPHVHKTAQEHFGIESYSIFLQFVNLMQLEKLVLFLKFFDNTFFDLTVKLQLELFFKVFLNFKTQLNKIFTPNNFLVFHSQSLVKFINLFNLSGELKLLTFHK